jgi:predicted RNA-binding Zn-ribbon protein involved in translation (DUF1610 family)
MIRHVDNIVTLRSAHFVCPNCERETDGRLMLRTRKALAMRLPLCRDIRAVVKCDACGAEQPTLLTDTVFDASASIPILDPATSADSAFPKLLLVLFSVTWCAPIVGLVIYWSLYDYGSQIRGGWLRLYGWLVWLTVIFHACWGCLMLYLFATGRL